jgi:SAM-dependent MidA family methyltransferase
MSAQDLIFDRIRERGPITVAEFMSIALYHPQHGYYARSAHPTGRHGDFITSVDVGPLFGRLLARQLSEMWRALQRQRSPARAAPPNHPDLTFDLVEAGAANGQLARDVLDAAAASDPEFYRAIRLHLVESSPMARRAHRETLGPHAAVLASSGGTLPPAIHGAVYANELLDALPVHSVVMTADGLRECYVDRWGDQLIERIGPLSSNGLTTHLESLGIALELGWRADINLAALAWTTRACLSLHRGFLLLIDYGHPARELYSETHAAGTLTTFVRHVAEQRRADAVPPWLRDPGERDITSQVDLTSIQHTAAALGCQTLGLCDQTYFLLSLLGQDELQDGFATMKPRQALKTLVLPGGIGSTHKVLILGKDVGQPQLRGLSGPSRLT